MNHADLIRRLSTPLAPIRTDVSSKIQQLDIQALLFDIYGTLLISGVGDIANADAHNEEAAQLAMSEAGLKPIPNAAQRLREAIKCEHERLKADGQPYPEVDIREMWQAAIQQEASAEQIELLAVGYELRVNPVWPMPHVGETLSDLQHLPLGIISNAQFMTPQLFEPLTGKNLEEWGFELRLCFYSFDGLGKRSNNRAAKPGRDLYQRAADELANMGLSPSQTLYVGNDMKKDVWAAKQLGFCTALFAGDQRSLRLHKNDETLAGVLPDLVITDLSQLKDCLIERG